MTIKRNLVSLVLMSILTAATMMFTACSNDIDIPVTGYGTAAEYLLPGMGHICIRTDRFEVFPNEKQDYWAMQVSLVMDQ